MDVVIHSQHKKISIWLFTVCAFIALMVLVGGLTRLTDSGLSITEWKPISGAIPPLTAQDWDMEFTKYKAIPEFQLVNSDFTLDEFKFIFWWEWGHRQLGRVIGLVFFIPFAWFAFKRQIPKNFMAPLLALFALGGLQGFMGWYMVQSGLTDRVDVSQYRLAMHLGLALVIFTFTFWLALRLWRGMELPPQSDRTVAFAGVIVFLTLLQSMMGALVAGLDAGKTYTDWPFMDGDLIPPGLLDMTPVSANFFENYLTVQFDHRIGAYVLLILVFVHLYRQHKAGAHTLPTARFLAAAVTGQAVLGITALMLAVPLFWGAVHQLGAVLVLALGITHLHLLRYPNN